MHRGCQPKPVVVGVPGGEVDLLAGFQGVQKSPLLVGLGALPPRAVEDSEDTCTGVEVVDGMQQLLDLGDAEHVEICSPLLLVEERHVGAIHDDVKGAVGVEEGCELCQPGDLALGHEGSDLRWGGDVALCLFVVDAVHFFLSKHIDESGSSQ